MEQIIKTMIATGTACINNNGYHYYIDMVGAGQWALYRTPLHKWGYDLKDAEMIATLKTA